MKVQKVRTTEANRVTWLVLGDDYLPIEPIREYLSYLNDLEKSPNTVRSYSYHLKLYWQYLKEYSLDWREINIIELAEFITWLRNPTGSVISLTEVEAKRTEATVNLILTSVCMLYDFHERTGRVLEIPLYRSSFMPGNRYKGFLHHITKSKPIRTRLLKLKEPKRIPKTHTVEEVRELIEACNRLRDKFLICLLYESGIRIGQALNLKLCDVRSWDNVIEIVPRFNNANGSRTKSTSPHSVDVSQDLMALYTQYLEEEFMEILGDNWGESVFVNLWDGVIGSPMTYSNVMALFTRLKRKTGIAITPHHLRHSHASELIRSKMPMAYVQKRLGHRSIQTTIDTYVHVTNEDMKNAYSNYLERREDESKTRTTPLPTPD